MRSGEEVVMLPITLCKTLYKGAFNIFSTLDKKLNPALSGS